LEGYFRITAEDNSGQVMAIRHKTHNLAGLQIHPESLIAEFGNNMIKNWLES
jgi:anthranilate synthase component 2